MLYIHTLLLVYVETADVLRICIYTGFFFIIYSIFCKVYVNKHIDMDYVLLSTHL